jgi:hypothetical protein
MKRLTATTLAATAALSLGTGAALGASSMTTQHGNTVRIRRVNRAAVRDRSTRERHGRRYQDAGSRELRDFTASTSRDR